MNSIICTVRPFGHHHCCSLPFHICFSGRKLDFSGIQAQFLVKDGGESSAKNFWGALSEKCYNEACLHGALPSGRVLSDHGA